MTTGLRERKKRETRQQISDVASGADGGGIMEPELKAIMDRLHEIDGWVEQIAIATAGGSQMKTLADAIRDLVIVVEDLTSYVDAMS